jgi:putative tryptophan/tyrosine transport system substrate-binding protein
MMRTWAIMVPILSLLFMTSPLAQVKKTIRLIRVGVVQMVSSLAMAEDQKGFEKSLAEAGFQEGTRVLYQRDNARGDKVKAQAISKRFLDEKIDLIHCIGTAASQVMVRTIQHIPVVFSSVTDPIQEDLVPKHCLPGSKTETNVTGVAGRVPVGQLLELFIQFTPRAKRWGTLYNASDVSSLALIKELREASKKLGIELIEATISQSSETRLAANSLAERVQAMHILSDPTALTSFEAIVRVCNEKKIPLFTGDMDSVSIGAIAAYGMDHFFMGVSAGRKARRIIAGDRPGDIPWSISQKMFLIVNEVAAKTQGAVIPPQFIKKADRIIN